MQREGGVGAVGLVLEERWGLLCLWPCRTGAGEELRPRGRGCLAAEGWGCPGGRAAGWERAFTQPGLVLGKGGLLKQV